MEIQQFLVRIIPYISASIDIIGIGIVIYGVISSLVLFVKHRFDLNSKHVLINLAQSLSLALEYMLAAEILKSMIIATYQELVHLAVIMILRLVMTFVLHWEIKASAEEGDAMFYLDKERNHLSKKRSPFHKLIPEKEESKPESKVSGDH